MSSGSKDPVWYVLDKIQEDIDRIEDKWERHLTTSTKLVENLSTVNDKVVELNKLLTKDNGKPSIITQLTNINTELNEVRTSLTDIKIQIKSLKNVVGVKSPNELRKQRWISIAKIVGYVSAALPGIFAFIHSYL